MEGITQLSILGHPPRLFIPTFKLQYVITKSDSILPVQAHPPAITGQNIYRRFRWFRGHLASYAPRQRNDYQTSH